MDFVGRVDTLSEAEVVVGSEAEKASPRSLSVEVEQASTVRYCLIPL